MSDGWKSYEPFRGKERDKMKSNINHVLLPATLSEVTHILQTPQ